MVRAEVELRTIWSNCHVGLTSRQLVESRGLQMDLSTSRQWRWRIRNMIWSIRSFQPLTWGIWQNTLCTRVDSFSAVWMTERLCIVFFEEITQIQSSKQVAELWMIDWSVFYSKLRSPQRTTLRMLSSPRATMWPCWQEATKEPWFGGTLDWRRILRIDPASCLRRRDFTCSIVLWLL